MIVLPGRAAGAFAAVLKACGRPRPRDAPVAVRVEQGGDGLSLTAWGGDVGLRWQAPGRYPAAAITLAADHLQQVGAAGGDVTLTAASAARGEAQGAGAAHAFPLADVDRVLPVPWPLKPFAPLAPSFLSTFAAATRTVARTDGGRFALARVQLRGTAGEVVASDGRQALVHRGFRFPWVDELLVPAVPAFGTRELAAAREVAVGRAADHVLVACGSWTVALPVDAAGRFPDVAAVTPKGPPVARCVLTPADVARLRDAVPHLPGGPDGAVTLTLDGGVVVAAGGDRAATVRLDVVDVNGAGRVTVDRRHLLHALALGLTAVEVHGPGRPVVARGGDRTLVWVPLEDAAEVPAPEKLVPLTPAPEVSVPTPTPHPRRDEPPNDPPPDLLAEAEAVRDLLVAAGAKLAALIGTLKRQKKQTRAFQQAVQSIRRLPTFDL